MRTLTDNTLSIQANSLYTPLVQVRIGGATFLSNDPSSGLVSVETVESGQSFTATIEIRPSVLEAIHPGIMQMALGDSVTIKWGFVGATNFISSPPLKVVAVSGLSEPGSVLARFTCVGWWELLASTRVVRDPITPDDPPPIWNKDTTIKSILTEVLVGWGNVWLDDDDGIINVYRPFYEADGLESALTTVRNLLDMTLSYIRIRDDGFHIVYPQDTDNVDNTYDLDGHVFFTRTHAVKATIPNRIVMVPSLPSQDEAPDFVGVAIDQDSVDKLGFLDMITADDGLESEGEANARAFYILQRLKAEGVQGLITVPMHIGQELYDKVEVIDSRIEAVPIYNFVGSIKKTWMSGKYAMEVGLGGLMPHLSSLPSFLSPGPTQTPPITIPNPFVLPPYAPPTTNPPLYGPPVPVFGPPEPPFLPVPIPAPTPPATPDPPATPEPPRPQWGGPDIPWWQR